MEIDLLGNLKTAVKANYRLSKADHPSWLFVASLARRLQAKAEAENKE